MGEKELGVLSTGLYTLQVRVVSGELEDLVLISEPSLLLRGINDYSDTISEINGYTIGTNFIDFTSMNGQMIMSVQNTKVGMNKIYEYNGVENTRVYDGWLNSEYDFNRAHQKSLRIENQNNEVVETIHPIPTWNIVKQFQMDVEKELEKSGFQATVPAAYRGKEFKKYVIVTDDETQKEIGKYELPVK